MRRTIKFLLFIFPELNEESSIDTNKIYEVIPDNILSTKIVSYDEKLTPIVNIFTKINDQVKIIVI